MTGTKCRGECNRIDKGFVKTSSYQDGKLKYCAICEAFVKKLHDKCPCCKFKLRNKPKSTKDRRSKEGDQAFVFFDLALTRAKNELGLLPICYSIPTLGEGFLQSVFAYLRDAINQLSILETEGRQRPEYLKAKRKQLDRFHEKVLKRVKAFYFVVYS